MTKTEVLKIVNAFKDLHANVPIEDPELLLWVKDLIFGGYYFPNTFMPDEDKYDLYNCTAEELHDKFNVLLGHMVEIGCMIMTGPIIDDTIEE